MGPSKSGGSSLVRCCGERLRGRLTLVSFGKKKFGKNRGKKFREKKLHFSEQCKCDEKLSEFAVDEEWDDEWDNASPELIADVPQKGSVSVCMNWGSLWGTG